MAMDNPKQAARKFVEHWTFRRGSEKGEDQQFWNSLLGKVLGIEDVKSQVQYQVPVPMKGATKFLYAWIPETRVLIEHKSRGINLEAPQAGHEANDRSVLAAYGLAPDTPEPEIVAHLFKLYAEMTKEAK